jgi:hypothetical protein
MVAGIVLFAFAMEVTVGHVGRELGTIPAFAPRRPSPVSPAFVLLRLRIARAWPRPHRRRGSLQALFPVALAVPALVASRSSPLSGSRSTPSSSGGTTPRRGARSANSKIADQLQLEIHDLLAMLDDPDRARERSGPSVSDRPCFRVESASDEVLTTRPCELAPTLLGRADEGLRPIFAISSPPWSGGQDWLRGHTACGREWRADSRRRLEAFPTAERTAAEQERPSARS